MRMRHFVNEDKRTVTTVIEDTENDVRRMLQKMEGADGINEYVMVMAYCSYLPNTFIGIAKCHPEDEFDIQKGIEISKAKAKKKYHKAVMRELCNFANKLEHFADNIDRKVDEIYDKYSC